MPSKPLRPCKHPGCHTLTKGVYCEDHRQRPPDTRPSANQRGYTYRWHKRSRVFLAQHPWCAECEKLGKRAPADVVDHIVPHKGDAALFWDEGNWQSLCTSCHGSKTAREDGGFGNKIPSPHP